MLKFKTEEKNYALLFMDLYKGGKTIFLKSKGMINLKTGERRPQVKRVGNVIRDGLCRLGQYSNSSLNGNIIKVHFKHYEYVL